MKPVTNTLIIAIVLSAGLFTGYYLAGSGTAPDTGHSDSHNPTGEHQSTTAPLQPMDDMTALRLEQMEARLAELQARIEQIENRNAVQAGNDTQTKPHTTAGAMSDSTADTPISAEARVLTVDVLTRAGLDPDTAADIVRRKNHLELQKLELRDKASRQGYLGSRRYMQELSDLVSSDISLHEELGDDNYDRYLYASGQANRVRVAAVMLGSAAEQAGLQQGDFIISYNGQRLFDWRALQQATTEGNREEYVSLTVERDGQQMLLWVPRGPLGVRLTTTRINPDR